MSLQLFARQSEVKLVEELNNIEKFDGWKALHFRLDGLLEEYKSDYHVKIAINLINDLLKTNEGGIFVLADRSIVVLCRGMTATLSNKLVFQLRYLYTDDPLAYTDDGRENTEFCQLYELETDRGAFVEFVSQCMARTVRKGVAPRTKQSAEPTPIDPGTGATVVDLNASRLMDIEEQLLDADISAAIRKQPVCALLSGNVRPVFDEIYIRIAHMRHLLKSEIDFFSNRWLFKHLTQVLDERVLMEVRGMPEQYLETPISLNLNVQTLLSSAFSRFDASIPTTLKVSIVIEVSVVDVFADMTAFLIAREEVQKQGYRVCLDGLTVKGLLHVDREKLGVDLVKVLWNAEAQSDFKAKENQELQQAVQRCGSKRLILCRCDNKQAVEYGQSLGIALFQGRYVDMLRNPNRVVEN
jgi:hypothetical protein